MQSNDCRADKPTVSFGKGYVQVYTGDGKGKTTAAIGLAVRAVGAGCRVLLAQFFKKGDYSEIKTLGQLGERIEVKQYGTGRFIGERPTTMDRLLFRKGLKQIKTDLSSNAYQIVILDEANLAVSFGLLSVDGLVDIIAARPEQTELIITGRQAHRKVIDAADLVTEMKEIKHYYRKGIRGRVGIEK
jgi:cob(I)alamin adenosyltransferase